MYLSFYGLREYPCNVTSDPSFLYLRDQHRLHVAGCQVGIDFALGCYEKIHHYSAGIPRLINRVCDHVLLAGFVQGRRTVNLDVINASVRETEGHVV